MVTVVGKLFNFLKLNTCIIIFSHLLDEHACLSECASHPNGIGTNYFSLFVSYRFMSNKTQLTVFPESKSDMSLFQRVLALN